MIFLSFHFSALFPYSNIAVPLFLIIISAIISIMFLAMFILKRRRRCSRLRRVEVNSFLLMQHPPHYIPAPYLSASYPYSHFVSIFFKRIKRNMVPIHTIINIFFILFMCVVYVGNMTVDLLGE